MLEAVFEAPESRPAAQACEPLAANLVDAARRAPDRRIVMRRRPGLVATVASMPMARRSTCYDARGVARPARQRRYRRRLADGSAIGSRTDRRGRSDAGAGSATIRRRMPIDRADADQLATARIGARTPATARTAGIGDVCTIVEVVGPARLARRRVRTQRRCVGPMALGAIRMARARDARQPCGRSGSACLEPTILRSSHGWRRARRPW